MKCWYISTCLVLSWWTGFFAMSIAALNHGTVYRNSQFLKYSFQPNPLTNSMTHRPEFYFGTAPCNHGLFLTPPCNQITPYKSTISSCWPLICQRPSPICISKDLHIPFSSLLKVYASSWTLLQILENSKHRLKMFFCRSIHKSANHTYCKSSVGSSTWEINQLPY